MTTIFNHNLTNNKFSQKYIKPNWEREEILFIKVSLIIILQLFLRRFKLCALKLQSETHTTELPPKV
jgi:hypothetical protein